MRSIKRLFATVTAGFDGFVDQVENHEAVAEAVIGDIRRKAAGLKVQLARLDQHIARLGDQRQQALEEAGQWRERALRVAEDDDRRGLYCARQHREAQTRARHLAARISEHTALRGNVERELGAVEDKLGALKLKKTLLSSRGAHAHASRVTAGVGSDECDAEGVFERWETHVTQDEYLAETQPAPRVDPLRAEFEEQEQQAELREQLSAWREGATKAPAQDDDGA